MDINTIIGFIIGAGCMIFGIVYGQAEPLVAFKYFVSPSSMFIVIGGTLAGLMVGNSLHVFKKIPSHLKLLFRRPHYDPVESIDEIVEFAKEARRKGLLALEEKASVCEDNFIRSSVMLIVDATEPERVREILEDELGAMEERHDQNRAFYEKAAALAPGFGMLGTLIGLILMLMNLDDADTLGPAMGVALVTTFYGSIMANLIFSPIASKLQERHDEEMLCKRIIVEGVLSMQIGTNPRHIREKLLFMLPERQRPEEEGEEGAAAESGGKGKKKAKKGKKGNE